MILSIWARQMRLLLWKNWILTWRNVGWLICEFIVPLAITLLVVALSAVAKDPPPVGASILPPWNLYGNLGDIEVIEGPTCQNTTTLRLAWTVNDPKYRERAGELMEKVKERLGSELQLDAYEEETSMMETLAQSELNNSRSRTHAGCYLHKYLGGITIRRITDTHLDYTINMPTDEKTTDRWSMETVWTSIYPPPNGQESEKRHGVYQEFGFLSLQFSIDNEFAKERGKQHLESIEMQAVPDPSYTESTNRSIVLALAALFPCIAFLAVIHSAREVAQERVTVKSFLSVMGLSTPMFYLSHIVFGCIKCCIIFSICILKMVISAEHVSGTLLLVIILIYSCGAVLFGVVIAALIKKPNTVLKVSILAWGVSYFVPLLANLDRDDTWKCLLHSLNINGAFLLTFKGLQEYMQMGVDIGWLNMFRGRNFSVGHGVLMMLFDVIWMTAAVFLFDFIMENVSNIDVISFIRRKILKRESDVTEKVVELDADQKDAGLTDTPKDIEIRNLVKMYPSSGQLAVNNLNLDVYRGQVTVLLGHNGAGKSTTFSMISGLTKPTEGSFTLCGKEVGVLSAREEMGLCPQQNCLFDKLTVDDHLYLIHGLKGGQGNWKDEGIDLLSDLGLLEMRHTKSYKLSGGMKRKLCVCMAVIGGSRVVLLDEPTAGMDPGARRDVEKLLLKIKGDRSVLLTTHYMDEAELLGDRIAIMAKGRVVCCGTAQYLKNKFGDGYQLTVALDDGRCPIEHKKKILEKAAAVPIDVSIKSINGKQLQFRLPTSEQEKFPALFEYLETGKKEMGVASFGLSFNTLEQVFLKVGELIEPRDQEKIKERKILNRKLIESQFAPRHTGSSLVLHQMFALLLKRFVYSRRNWCQLFTQFVMPMMCLAFVGMLSMNSKQNVDILGAGRQIDIASFGKARVILDMNLPEYDRYKVLIHKPGVELVEYNGLNVSLFILDLPKYFPPPSFGVALDNATGNYHLIYNHRSVHSLPISLNLFSNSRLNENEGISVSLQLYNLQKDESKENKGLPKGSVNFFVAVALVVVFALLTSAFVIFLIEERVSKFGHQQSLSGISPIVFWGTSFLYDFLVYSFFCSIFLGVFFINLGWFEGYLHFILLFWFLYFFASVSFIYAMSFIFNAASKANVLLIVLQIVIPCAVLTGQSLLRLFLSLLKMEEVAKSINYALYVLLPSYNLFAFQVALSTWSQEMEQKGKDDSIPSDILVPHLLSVLLFAAVSIITFVLFQFKSVRFAAKKLFDWRNSPDMSSAREDSDVVRERMKEIREQDVALTVVGLKKRFNDTFAIDDLTFSVQNKECFGLLGVNGAGKTTTFDILTGQNYPSSGTAHIGGVSVDNQIAIGYCPQFDALMDDLTGRETLMIMARLYGFTDPTEKTKLILRAVGLYEHRHKLTKYYSGGQKRKLSTGMALMAPARIVILDEPTAGIDPTARRDIWEVLSNVRDHSDSSILLTSHSMEECEALCSRVAILKRGRMVAIGTSQHLKTKYGNSYTMFMVAKSSQHRCQVIKKVAEVYPRAVLKSADSAQSLTLRWQLPKTRDDKWSVVFAGGLRMAKSLQVEDFCLAQSSLEEAFLQISNQDNQTNQGNQGMVVANGGVAITVPLNRPLPTNQGMVVGNGGDVITVPTNRATPITTASPMSFNAVSNATTGTSASTASFSTTSTASTSNENNHRGL